MFKQVSFSLIEGLIQKHIDACKMEKEERKFRLKSKMSYFT